MITNPELPPYMQCMFHRLPPNGQLVLVRHGTNYRARDRPDGQKRQGAPYEPGGNQLLDIYNQVAISYFTFTNEVEVSNNIFTHYVAISYHIEVVISY